MTKVTLDNITDVVVASLGRSGPITDRQREIMTAAIRHLHGFCRDVRLQHHEFIDACMFLARAGALCGETRQEFILLGDILGVEVLTEMLSNPAEGRESEGTVMGPFYRENPPVLPKGTSIVRTHFDNEESVYFEGHVYDGDGYPVAGAILDVWQDAPNGLYENQDHNQADYNLRGRFQTDANGHYAFRTVRPVPYPIPDTETAGDLIRFMGHHTMRPGHIHFIVSKAGHRTLISQVYDSSSPWLEDDAVFAVKESLVATYGRAKPSLEADLHVSFDFALRAEAAACALAAE